jgi:hypothetical protein
VIVKRIRLKIIKVIFLMFFPPNLIIYILLTKVFSDITCWIFKNRILKKINLIFINKFN